MVVVSFMHGMVDKEEDPQVVNTEQEDEVRFRKRDTNVISQ